MPTKIRLQRKGKKGQPFYHIVIADGRAPRDGKFIEKIGTYNPLTKPANVDMDFDRALYWLQTGAEPTDTVRAILSYKGVLYKNHLANGVKKGALTQEQANAKFDGWLKEKEDKIQGKVNELESEERNEAKRRLEAERKINEDRANDLAAKRAAVLKAEEKAQAPAEEAEEQPADAEATTEEAVAETEVAPVEEVKEEVNVEEVVAEVVTEEPKVEVVAEEPIAEAVVEEPKAEVAAEEPKEEEKAEEPKAETPVEDKEEETKKAE